MASTACEGVEVFCGGTLGRGVLVVSAHPDDEVIGLGAQLPRLTQAQFLLVTNGAAADGSQSRSSITPHARQRRVELRRAFDLAGIGRSQCLEMGFPDQGVSTSLVPLSLLLAGLLRALRPETIITHPYEGGHPDHDGTAFAVQTACRMFQREGLPAPTVLEMTSYHMGPGGIEPGVFLGGNRAGEIIVELDPEQKAYKQRLLNCFPSQRETLQYFPPTPERFRVAPAYDFSMPPHPGQLFYEKFDWKMTGEQFRELAAAAGRELGIRA